MYIKINKYFLVIISTVIISLSTIILPLIFSISSNLISNNLRDNIVFIVWIIFIMLNSLLINIIFCYIREKVSKKINEDNFNYLFKQLFEMKYVKLMNIESTYLIDCCSQHINNMYSFFSSNLGKVISSIIIIIVSLILVYRINIFIFIMLALVFPISLFYYRILNSSLKKRSKILQENTATGFKDILNVSSNIDFLKKQYDYNIISKTIEKSTNKIYNSLFSINVFAQIMSMIIDYLNSIIRCIIIVILADNILFGNMSVLDLMIVSLVLSLYFNEISSFVQTNLNYTMVKEGNSFIANEVIKERETTIDNGIQLENISKIEFNLTNIHIKDGVNLHYQINETFEIGDVVFLHGPSGSGKSSIFKSMLGFYKASQIMYNDIDMDQLNKLSIRKRITYITQTPMIFSGTIAENLMLNENNIIPDIEDITIKSLINEKGLDYKINGNGDNLSGGEKQRINVSREMCNPKDIVLCDEICSSLDQKSAYKILSRIIKYNRDKIIFIISHDLSIKELCNKDIKIPNACIQHD